MIKYITLLSVGKPRLDWVLPRLSYKYITLLSVGKPQGGEMGTHHTGFKAVSTGRECGRIRHCGLDPQSRGAAVP